MDIVLESNVCSDASPVLVLTFYLNCEILVANTALKTVAKTVVKTVWQNLRDKKHL